VEAAAGEGRAGGVTVNGTIWHMVQHELPFGRIGSSGIGGYHGEAGFEHFSHMKSVFIERRFSGARLLRPPFGKIFDLVLNGLRAIA
jgi:coniferyl-aldehyde dehydrogenase